MDWGPAWRCLGLFKSSFWNDWGLDGQHEAHFARHGPIGTNVSLLLQWQRRCAVPPAGPLIPNGRPMACADPSGRVGPNTDIPCFAEVKSAGIQISAPTPPSLPPI